MQPQRPVVFSDLDGTLLDHDSYSWESARPALDALKARDIPLVLVSSKTRAELLPLRVALDNHHPYIVENGAAIYVPAGYLPGMRADDMANGDYCISEGPPRATLNKALQRVREEDCFVFTTFSELGSSGIARETGLEPAQAAAANARAASEPLLWQDSPQRLVQFSERLTAMELRCVRGGRFVHVMGQFDKADAVAELLDRYAEKFPSARLVSIALGDGPNDLDMLALADIAVVVRGRHDHDMSLDASPQVIRTQLHGPEGWRDAVLQILDVVLPQLKQ